MQTPCCLSVCHGGIHQLGYTRDCVTCTDELQAWNKSHKKKSEPVKISEMSWSKSKRKTSKTKRQAEDHQDPRALSERGHVAARLHAQLEDLESSDPLAHCSRAPGLNSTPAANAGGVESCTSDLSMDQDVHEDSALELTPVPSECEWMDTER